MGEAARIRQAWTDDENDVVVRAYLELLRAQQRGERAVKADFNRLVRARTGRTKGSVEYKFQNVSAVMLEMGLDYVKGYLPAFNVQRSLSDAVARNLTDAIHTELIQDTSATVLQEADDPRVDFEWSPLHKIPVAAHTKYVKRHRRAMKVDFAAVEAQNKSLGNAGELAVLRRERAHLTRLGLHDLANRVRHVSVEDGDGLGYDILSFTPEGEERFIEVKTTRRDRLWPMLVSSNEVEFSKEEASRFELHRVFKYAPNSAGIYVLPGSIERSCTLRPTLFSAVPKAS